MMESQAIALLIAVPLATAFGVLLKWLDYSSKRPVFTYRGIGYRYDRCSPYLDADLRAVLDALLDLAPEATAGIWVEFVAGAASSPFVPGGVLPDGTRAKASIRTARFLPITRLNWVVVCHRDTTVLKSGLVHEVVYHLARMRRGLSTSDVDHHDPELKALERKVIDRAISLGAVR